MEDKGKWHFANPEVEDSYQWNLQQNRERNRNHKSGCRDFFIMTSIFLGFLVATACIFFSILSFM